MLEEIIKEKTSADHLLYVSLKYTKTCDVILNLLARWKSLIEISFDALIDQYIELGKISEKPISPKQRIEFMRLYFKKVETIQRVIPLYVFFKRVPDLPKSREGEFRKNVNLKVKTPKETVCINLEKLSEYSTEIDFFIQEVKKFLL